MAQQTIEEMVISISADPKKVLAAFELISQKLEVVIGAAENAGVDVESLLGIKTDDSTKSVVALTDESKKAAKEVQKVGDAGQAAGKNVAKGAKDAEKSLLSLQGISSKVFSAIKTYAMPVIAMFGAKTLFGNFISEGDQLDKLSKSVRMNVSDLDAWRKANVAAGGSADAFTNAVKSFTERTGASGDTFIRMATTLNGMTGQQANYALKYLGLSRESAEIFLKQNGEMKSLVEKYRAFALTPEDAENARRFRISWSTLGMTVNAAGMQVAKFFVPMIEKGISIFGNFSDFVARHGEFIRAAIVGIAAAATLAFGYKSGLGLAAKAIAALTSPVGIAIALILLLAAAFDDLASFARGGGSVFEDVLKKIGKSDAEIQQIRETLLKAGEAISKLGEVLAPVGNLLTKVFVEIATFAIESFVTLIGSIATVLSDAITGFDIFKTGVISKFEAIKEKVKPIVDWVMTAISSVTNVLDSLSLDKLKGFFGFGGKEVKVSGPAFPDGKFADGASVAASRSSKAQSIKTDATINNTINVGNGDPAKIQEAVSNGTYNAMQKTTEFTANSASGFMSD